MHTKKNLKMLKGAYDKLHKNEMAKLRNYYAKNYEKSTIKDNVILYESRDGQSLTGSPLAFFISLCRDSRFKNIQHVWVIDGDSTNIKTIIPEDCLAKVTFVIRNTKKYIDYLLTAKYLITNATFQSFFSKKDGQVYINTWHGTPLKYMGYDIPGNPKHSQNVIRNLLMTDYFLSPSPYTSRLFSNSYKLKDIYPGKIVETGYPRIDFTFKTNLNDNIKFLSNFGVKLTNNKPIALYMPTWKGTSIKDPIADIEQIVAETTYLRKRIANEYQLLVKVHPYVYPYVKDRKEVNEYLIPDYLDPNQVLGWTDLLITDYSSVFFDFLVTNKPIIFYAWDKDIYDDERGMYLDEKDLPGPVASTMMEVVRIIKNINETISTYEDKYKEAKEKFVPYEDGGVTQRCINYIFFGQDFNSKEGRILDINSMKTKLLIYPGNLSKNGITSSFLNLLNNIDYNNYDVTVFTEPGGEDGNTNIRRINRNARVLFKPGAAICSVMEEFRNRQIKEFTLPSDKKNIYPDTAFRREANRLLANLSFDVAIDFSGYGFFWAKLILGAKANKYIVYQHNDLLSDSQKVVNGKKPHKKSLPALFSIYYKFDRILSVSPITMEINKKKLNDFINDSQIGYSINTINAGAILGENDHSYSCAYSENSLSENIVPVRIDKFMKIKIGGQYKLYSSLYRLINSQNENLLNLTKDNVIHLIAKVKFNGFTYYKCLVDGIYTGWILGEYLENTIQLFNTKNCHKVATVLNKKNKFIWKKVEHAFERDRVTKTMYLKNSYVFLDKEVETSFGKFYRVIYNNKPIGWIQGKAIGRIHDISFSNPLIFYFLLKNKRKNIGISQEFKKCQKYVMPTKLFFEEGECWSHCPGTTFERKKDNLLEPEKIYEVRATMIVQSRKFYEVREIAGKFLAWVESRFISEVSEEKALERLQQEEELVNEDKKQKNQVIDVPVANFDQSKFNFVTMGRLSPEKNYGNLIAAFANFLEIVPEANLYILGQGKLEDNLATQIFRLGIQKSVHLLGYIDNPFNFIEQNDVFVLPSIYEGQPMVLLEAMTLGKKILATNIPANVHVLGEQEDYGLFTNGTEINDLYEGLIRIYRFNGNFKRFDYQKYNKKAINNFYNELKLGD